MSKKIKSNILKKTVTLTYLITILFSLFFPFNQSLAYPELVIKSDNLTLNSGEYIYISAEISELVNKTITFTSSPTTGVTFTPNSSCTTASGNPSFCSVQFTSTIIGEYTISAKTEYNGTLESNLIKINVTKKNISPTCTPPKVLDPVLNKCIDCTTPKIIIGGKCEDKVTEESCKAVNRVVNTTTNRCDCISPNKEVNGLCTTPTTLVPGSGATTDTTYNPLAPLPGLDTTIDTTGTCPFGNYLNIMIKLVIGIAAVLAMVMIVMGGIEYMTSDLISSKEAGKETIKNALLGLFIALGAYLILNTINPKLLSACLDNLPVATIEIIENFEFSGGLTFDGEPIKVNFNQEAYPAAVIASQKTGVETAFILAMFAQETSSGANTGKCNYSNANMGNGQLDALKTVAGRLNLDYTKINMSCSGGGSTHGGAIGLTQFLPGTWLEYVNEAKQLLGHEPNPWNVNDALMMTALFLKHHGGAGSNEKNQYDAACAYFGSCNVTVSCGDGKSGTYGTCILGKKVSIQQQIDNTNKK